MAIDTQETDESLMARVCSGDHQAFAVLTQRYSGMIYAAAYRMCQSAPDAEEIAQEALLKLWTKPQSFDAGRGVKLSTWLYRVVSNLAIDRMRREKKWRPGGEHALEALSDQGLRADDAMMMDERERRLETAIKALPERQKLALNLCFYEGLSNKDAAEVMGVGVKALESLLMRAKAGVKDYIDAQSGAEERRDNEKGKAGSHG